LNNLAQGSFDAIFVEGLQPYCAVDRLIMQAAQGRFHPASCRVLVSADDPVLAAALPGSVITLLDWLAGRWPPSGRLFGWAVLRLVRHRQRHAWRQFGWSSAEHKRLMRKRLAFMGKS
jgi:hypothetical protein